MKYAVSVAELLELHHLGELFVKWATNPVAMSEADVEELQQISEKYSVNGTSALFSFQRQFHREFGLTAANTVSIHEVAKEVLAIADAKREAEYQDDLVVKATEQTGVIEPVLDPELEAMRARLREDTERVTHVLDSDGFLKPTGAEKDEALREQLQEDNEVDREMQAMQAGELRVELMEQNDVEREIEILQQLSDVDELTPEESKRFDELVSHKVSRMNSGTHKIPAGVLAEAVSGNEKGSK